MELYEYSVNQKANLDTFVKSNLDKVKIKKGIKEVFKHLKNFGYHAKVAILCKNTKPASLLDVVITELKTNNVPFFYVDSFYYISSLLEKNFKCSVGLLCADSKLSDTNNILTKLLQINGQ